ncbi:hypothetical protein NL493_30675, partial [Klebsiella pneumoniae]|nr:hypothetical protein [Klebsiella pneumoniae]
AILFSTLRDKAPAQNVDELKKRVEAYETPASRKEERPASERRSEPAPATRPEQRELLQRERPVIDQQIDTTLNRLRE